jgi:hypothetical protein
VKKSPMDKTATKGKGTVKISSGRKLVQLNRRIWL